MNVAEAITDVLVAEGVRVASGITGQSVGYITDALVSMPEITLCYTRQERVAFDVCDGYTRVSGQPGVIFTDSGPAVVNGLGGLVNSYGDSTPLLYLAGANNRFEVARRAAKELPIHDVFTSVTKWTIAIIDPSQVEQVLRRAFVALRSGRPGPVVIEVPYDVSRMQVPDFSYQPVGGRVRTGGDPQAVKEAVEALARAQRPLICAGAGVLFAEATPELVELAEMLTLPVTTTLNGKSAFPENHPLSLGLGGVTRATYATVQATRFAEEADVILAIGCSFNKHVILTPIKEGVTLIQVDVDPYEIDKEVPADIAILGDAKLVLRQVIDTAWDLVPASRLRPRSDTFAQIDKLQHQWMAISKPLLESSERPINPFRVTWELTQLLDPDQTIVTHDAGSVRGSISHHYTATVPRGFLGYGVQSAMGWSLGAAIGAKLAAPEKVVVAITGDEAFGETGLDLVSAVRVEAPILVVIKNNGADRSEEGGVSPKLSAIRGKPAGDFSAIAQAMNAWATRVEDPDALRGALREAIARVRGGETALVDVITKRVPVSLHRYWEGA